MEQVWQKNKWNPKRSYIPLPPKASLSHDLYIEKHLRKNDLASMNIQALSINVVKIANVEAIMNNY